MATTGLIDFTTPYTGGPSFYTGTGSTSLVPDVFPVALSGHAYLIDVKSGRFGRGFEPRVRDSVDQSALPGEAAISPQGLWRRAQASWHKGSGQKYADTGDAQDYRFWTSKGIDPWTKGELRLLPTTSKFLSSANTNLRMCVTDGRLYVSDGQTLKYTTDLSNFTTVTGTPAASIEGLTTDGYNVWASFAGNGIYVTDTSSSAATSYSTGHEWNQLQYVKGRLMAFGRSTDSYKLWNITSSGNNPAVLYTHPNTKFNWVGAAGGQQHIYVGGYAGGVSLIYRTNIKADGTALDIPTQAAELPIGEVIHCLYGYLSYIIVGTNKGVRFCTSDGDGNLVVGPILETPNTVYCATGDGKYVWYGWSNFDGTSTGLGRMDLSELTGVNEPAYASDLMATAQGDVLHAANWSGTRLFSVSGDGIYKEDTALVSEGYVEAGTYRWGVPDRKFLPRFDMRTEPLNGTVVPYLNHDSSGYTAQTGHTIAGDTEKTIPCEQVGFSDVAVKLVLTRSTSTTTLGPVLTRWQARAYAAPTRARVFSIPVILHKKLNLRGREYYQNVIDERTFLEALVQDSKIVTYQEGDETFEVVVENVEWVPLEALNTGWEWQGTAIVTARSIE